MSVGCPKLPSLKPSKSCYIHERQNYLRKAILLRPKRAEAKSVTAADRTSRKGERPQHRPVVKYPEQIQRRNYRVTGVNAPRSHENDSAKS